MSCADDAPDLLGCACAGTASTRACWPSTAPPASRGVGACHDGSQSCESAGEFSGWGACSGATLPATENCTNGVDDDCDGNADCKDADCALDPSCGCQDGQTRPCYDGPPATENVGTCKDGTQTCAGGHWPTACAGEVLPATEACTDALDHDCNHLPGCLDVFACATNPACQQQCKVDGSRMGCVCPEGTGDTATCPAGFVGITSGGIPGTVQCCPCTANDCANAVCCAETVCKNDPRCGGLSCRPLPPSCGGKVNLDCDDFPEDCDEPCCPCSTC
ncbi:MAG: Tryptophan synthase alpha chain [bacterium]|nr:Tryptophan synthase alpha chain [bacterium]